jgi:hypothetical protein
MTSTRFLTRRLFGSLVACGLGARIVLAAGQPDGRAVEVNPTMRFAQWSTANVFECNLGVVKGDALARFDVPVMNRAAVEWHVKRTSTSCGCVRVIESPERIRPGETAKFRLEFSTRGKRGTAEEWARFNTHEPGRPILLIRFSAVLAGVWSEPDQINFGTFSARDATERTVNLLASEGPSRHILRIESDSDFVSLTKLPTELSPELKKKEITLLGQYRLKLDPSKMHSGAFHAQIRVTTDSPDTPQLIVDQVGYLLGNVSIRPAVVNFGTLHPGDRIVRKCEITFPDQDRPIEASKLSFVSTNASVKAALSKSFDPAPKSLNLEITWFTNAESLRGFTKGEIAVRSGANLVASIPYSALVIAKDP